MEADFALTSRAVTNELGLAERRVEEVFSVAFPRLFDKVWVASYREKILCGVTKPSGPRSERERALDDECCGNLRQPSATPIVRL
jgi:hypothetical protein